MKLKTTTPFVYKWTEISTGMWYIGARFANGCHPYDGYICSSKVVKPKILSNPSDWVREILEICESQESAQKREAEILLEVNAAHNPQSYNQTNADGKFHRCGPHRVETIMKMKEIKSGERNPMFGRPGPMRGKKHREESKIRIGAKQKGRITTDEHAQKISQSLTGLTWINDGTHSRRINLQEESLPEGWKFGLLEEHAQKMGEAKQGEKHWNYGKSHRESTKQKIAESLTGRTDSAELKLKKKLGSKKREKVKCEGCGKLYLTCHKRHHLKCV
jgi:hypothetical protein